jgi:hypothetical protein
MAMWITGAGLPRAKRTGVAGNATPRSPARCSLPRRGLEVPASSLFSEVSALGARRAGSQQAIDRSRQLRFRPDPDEPLHFPDRGWTAR